MFAESLEMKISVILMWNSLQDFHLLYLLLNFLTSDVHRVNLCYKSEKL